MDNQCPDALHSSSLGTTPRIRLKSRRQYQRSSGNARSGRSDGRDAGVYVLPVAIGVATAIGARSVQISELDRFLFASVLVSAALVSLRAVGTNLPPRMSALVVGWIFLSGCYLVVGVFVQPHRSMNFVIGDFALALYPLAVALAYAARPQWLRRRAPLIVLFAFLMLAAVVARLFGMLGTRHEAPSSLLIAGSWYFLLRGRTPATRIVAGVGVALTLALALSSGYRTHLVLGAVAPLIIAGFLGMRNTLKVIAVSAPLAVVTLALIGVQINPLGALESSRFESVLSGNQDESLQSRELEAKDVLETVDNEWIPGQFLLGHGFGATYKPHYSYIERNVGSDGRVHNVHIGPMLVWLRFGLIGALAYCLALVTSVRTLIDIRRGRIGQQDEFIVGTWALAFLLFSVEFLTLNSTVQVSMGWALGGLIASRFARDRSEVAEDQTVV